MKSRKSKTISHTARCFIILVLAASALAASSFVHAAAVPQTEKLQITESRNAADLAADDDPSAVLTAFEAAINTHNVDVAVSLFTGNALVIDASNIACLYGFTYTRCQPLEGLVYTPKAQIRGWLQLLAAENIQVKRSGVVQSVGNNATWTWQVSVDEYRRLNIAPLVGTGLATVEGNLIKYLKFVLTVESEEKLQIAFATVRQSPYSAAAGGFAIGVIALGLVFPAAAAYYVSRVKRLFAAVPMLDKPWMILLAGVGALFLSVLLVALRDLGGMSQSVVDPIFNVILVVCAFLLMAAMILMKRIMISESDE